jgi:hypothetical protein
VTRVWGALLFLSIPLAAGCSGQCQVIDLSSCNPGLVCAPVGTSGDTACVPPIEVRGQVVDAATGEGIRGAFLHAIDQSGVSAAQLSTTGRDGAFTLRLLLRRTDNLGTPEPTTVTLEAQAQGYGAYPGKIDVAQVLDTQALTHEGGEAPYVFESPKTQLALSPLPSGKQDDPFIAGAVEISGYEGSPLVVAQANGQGVADALADAYGQFVLLNVPPGTYDLALYAQHAAWVRGTGLTVDVNRSANGVLIGQSGASLGTVRGSVTLPSGSGPTSVLLIPRSVFDETTGRGTPVPSLRAPTAGTPADVTGAFSIEGVPDGDYYVVPSYENDGLVRKPGVGFHALGVQDVAVTNGVASPATAPALEVVPAVALTSPGASAEETVGATPTLKWSAYPGAARYTVRVFDFQGTEAFSAEDVSGTSVAVAPALAPGLYQWRVVAKDGSGALLSQSEDLLGIFRVE